MLMKYFFLVLFVQFFTSVIAQPTKPEEYGLKSYTINDKKLGNIHFYIDTTGITKKKPIFLDINGSGGFPLCIYVQGKGFESLMNTFNASNLNETKEKYHYVILDKPSTAFCDTVKTTQSKKDFDAHSIVQNYKPSDGYTQKFSLSWRVDATKTVLSYLIKNSFWDKTKIVGFGYSEGAQVVPALATSDKRITHVIPVAGSGLNQLYDFIIDFRIKARLGIISERQAQDSINKYTQQIREIYENPNDTERMFEGHTYKRWASFGNSISYELLRNLNIPIYVIAATRDNSSPIFGLDYIQLEFIRLGKKNLTYDVCVGCDHNLANVVNEKPVEHTDYFKKVLNWIDRN